MVSKCKVLLTGCIMINISNKSLFIFFLQYAPVSLPHLCISALIPRHHLRWAPTPLSVPHGERPPPPLVTVFVRPMSTPHHTKSTHHRLPWHHLHASTAPVTSSPIDTTIFLITASLKHHQFPPCISERPFFSAHFSKDGSIFIIISSGCFFQ